MAPKKDKKKKDEGQPELVTAYKAREPLPPTEEPDVSEVDGAWKRLRDHYVLPLPEWNAEEVDTTDWRPNETEAPFVSSLFSVVSMPRSFMGIVAGWRRAGAFASRTGDLLPEEPEPQVQPIPELKEESGEPVPDPKAKAKPKAREAKAKAKGQAAEEVPEKPTTAQQYADFAYEGEARVVSQAEFRSRELLLDLDDATPQLSQAIASQFAAVAEHRLLLPRGTFLWELIYPQDEEGVPLFNPNGKYIVKLFLQGKWRKVLIDDVVPIGYAMHGNNMYAPLLPTSTDNNIIWPQLLAKALIQAFQDDLSLPLLPCITALTGWIPYQLPLSWHGLGGLKSVRTFCCLRFHSQVDFEARQRAELIPSIPAEAPRKSLAVSNQPGLPPLTLHGVEEKNLKLSNQPQEALLEFLICETEEEPRQVRLKADAFVPQHGTERKQLRDADSEEEDASADAGTNEQPARVEEEVDDSEHDEDEDDDGGSQKTPSGDAEAEKRTEGESVNGEGQETEALIEEEPVEDSKPWVAPWPSSNPAPLMMKSSIQEFQAQLEGGSWVSFEEIESAASHLCSYIPPGDHVLSATLDTCWGGDRSEVYVPPKTKLLRIRLVTQELDQAARMRESTDSKPAPGPPLFQTVFFYEPLRQNFRLEEQAPPPTPCSCILQAVNSWRRSRPPSRSGQAQALEPPERINLTAGHANEPSGSVYKSLLLPPGEHWYLIHDDAAEEAGSVLSVHVESLLLNSSKSFVNFIEPEKALAKHTILPMGPISCPVHTGFSVWAKAEIQIAEEMQTYQLFSHISDPRIWPYIQLSCLRVAQQDQGEELARCANWSVSTLVKSPLLRTMSLPLAKATKAKYVLMLEANLPAEVLPKSSSELLLQLLIPPGSSPPETDPEGDKDKEAEDGSKDEAPLQLQMLTVNHVLRWQGDCTENDKGLVLCERITVAPETGDVTSALRVSVEGLPQAFLRATLVAQLPPSEDMRLSANPDVPLEPPVPGAPLNPRDYSGRRNWLSSCRKVAETSGLEIVFFPHVLLTEASTYLLYVHLDEFRGPERLDGGTWSLESFGSGALEVGPDSMEQDLEELVRRSWAAAQPEDGVPRSETAAVARDGWLASKESPQASEELAAALERTQKVKHQNDAIAHFLCGHAVTEAMLIQEDPYTVAPDRPEWHPNEPDLGPVAPEETQVAVRAMGTEGEREARASEIELARERWETANEKLEAAKERNANQILELRQWREERSSMPAGVEAAPFAPSRRELRGALHSRLEKCAALKVWVLDEKRSEPDFLRAALSEAEAAGSRNYDSELMEKATKKLRLLDAKVTFQEALSNMEAKLEAATAASAAVSAAEGSDSLPEAQEAAAAAEEEVASATKELSESLSDLQARLKEVLDLELPCHPELRNEEPWERASELLGRSAEAAAAPNA